jgi:hypothetical protein
VSVFPMAMPIRLMPKSKPKTISTIKLPGLPCGWRQA